MQASRLLRSQRATLKLLFVGFLSLAMLIPLGMVHSIISDRQNLQFDAESTIAHRWGGTQSVGGLVALMETPGKVTDNRQLVVRDEWKAVTLSDLVIGAVMATEYRYLGIYQVPVYTTHLLITGRLGPGHLAELQTHHDLVLWLPLSDVRGIREISVLRLGELEISAQPLGVHPGTISGLQFTVPASELPLPAGLDYRLELKLAGSHSIQFLPLADTTHVELESDWPHPEFIGQYLPSERDISDSGVRANWQLLGLNRPFGDHWTVEQMPFGQLNQAAFGMRLETPVDAYQRGERSVKYGFLFIALTFFTLFLFEVMTGRPLHPVPYVLTGAALAVFYLVLLALSEYLPFTAAFAVAAGLLVGIVTPYTGAVLGKRRRGYLIGVMLTVTYLLLYLLVSAEQASLLLGSFALLAAIAALMYLTRGIDWYAYGEQGQDTPVKRRQ